MSHTITAKLNRAARTHKGEKGTTFFVSLGEQNFDYSAKTKVWTNYEAAIFCSNPNQLDYYSRALTEGAVITVSCSGLIPKNEDQYGIKLVMQDARLEFASFGDGQARAAAPQQQAYLAPAQQQQPAAGAQGFSSIDDGIPF